MPSTGVPSPTKSPNRDRRMHETGTKWLLDQKSPHLLFELCLGFKALFALAEIVTGVATYLVPQRYFLTLVVSVTRDEFAEDPHVIERHTDAGLAYCASHSPRHDVGKWNVPLPPGFASYILAKMSSGDSPSRFAFANSRIQWMSFMAQSAEIVARVILCRRVSYRQFPCG